MPPTPEQESEMQVQLAGQVERMKGRLPGRLLFHRIAGSRGHNLHTERSDWDFLGVFAVPTTQVLGLKKVEPVVTQQADEGDRPKDPTQPDYQYFEVGKFCEMLAKGNPTAVECLYAEHGRARTLLWDEIEGQRDRFLTASLVGTACGFAAGQLRLYRKKGYLHTTGGTANEKWFYHLRRLLNDARRVLAGGFPMVWHEGAERDAIMHIRRNVVPYDELAAELEVELSELAEADRGHLPQAVDIDAVSDWLVRVRIADLN